MPCSGERRSGACRLAGAAQARDRRRRRRPSSGGTRCRRPSAAGASRKSRRAGAAAAGCPAAQSRPAVRADHEADHSQGRADHAGSVGRAWRQEERGRGRSCQAAQSATACHAGRCRTTAADHAAWLAAAAAVRQEATGGLACPDPAGLACLAEPAQVRRRQSDRLVGHAWPAAAAAEHAAVPAAERVLAAAADLEKEQAAACVGAAAPTTVHASRGCPAAVHASRSPTVQTDRRSSAQAALRQSSRRSRPSTRAARASA